MATLELLDRETWEAFTQAPLAFLMLGKKDCEHCAKWTDELTAFLAADTEFAAARFGKLLIDTPGLGAFKKANPWLAEVEVLPYNLLYQAGQRVKDWPGGGIDRLVNRLRRITSGDPG